VAVVVYDRWRSAVRPGPPVALRPRAVGRGPKGHLLWLATWDEPRPHGELFAHRFRRWTLAEARASTAGSIFLPDQSGSDRLGAGARAWRAMYTR